MFYVNNSAVDIGDASFNLSSSDITASKSLVDEFHADEEELDELIAQVFYAPK